jgi:hypothetical protein
MDIITRWLKKGESFDYLKDKTIKDVEFILPNSWTEKEIHEFKTQWEEEVKRITSQRK